MSTLTYTADEMMAVEAARRLRDGTVCFVGIGLPSLAANLARATHAPGCVLIYESGTIGSKPQELPLSIGDGELAETADAVVSVPEIFAYWLQAGRIDVGFLGAAQIDKHGNLNSTVIGDYARPKVRLPGAGGAPEIATLCREVFVMLRQTRRSFVERLDFRTSVGSHVNVVVTDLGILEPDPETRELTLVRIHPGVEPEEARAATGWELRVADDIAQTDAPILTEERDRCRRRLDYWQERVRDLGGGLDFDPALRTIRHSGQAIRLSRREAELLSFLLEHPGQRFAPRELAARAWLAPKLSSEQVRNYVVRLRRKLSGAAMPCTLVSEPGAGYSLKWS